MKRGDARDQVVAKNYTTGELFEIIAQMVYYLLYCVGVRIIRAGTRLHRRLRLTVLRAKWFLRRRRLERQEARQRGGSLSARLRRHVRGPIVQTAENLRAYRQSMEAATVRDSGYFRAARRLELRQALQPLSHLLRNALAYLMPVCGLVALVLAFQYFGSQTYALRVEYNGEYIGYVYSEDEFNQAEVEVRNRLINEAYLPPENHTPVYTLERVEPDQLTDLDVLTNNIIQASGNEIQEATGLYVDGQFIGAVTDNTGLIEELKSIKQEDLERETGEDVSVSFLQDVKISRGLYPVSSLQDLGQINAKLTSEVEGEKSIIIQEGDTAWDISLEVGVPVETLLNLNPEVSKTMLVGEKFVISKMKPFLQKKVEKTVVEEQEVAYKIEREVDSNKSSTYSQVVQEGQNGLNEVTSRVTYVDGYEIESTVIENRELIPVVNEKVVVGSLTSSIYNPAGGAVVGGTNAGGYIWPVAGGYISCPIWGYSGHTGTDIAANAGTSIFAAKSGTVIHAGWSNGYGYNVLLQHPDGTKTRYAHCSSLGVYVGQQVSQGQVIAYVGRTGWATGNHCHFEIISNGSFLDARNYIGYSR